MTEEPEQDAEEDRPRILLVDDEENVLSGLRRQLAMDYDVVTATSGFLGLRAIRDNGPFAVVISDMQMPRMNGAWFLSRVHENFPRIVRILLTGHADLESAMEAVNRGRIFEFLTKPCGGEELRKVLEKAVEHHRVLEYEARLLEETLSRSINMLAEVLELVNPVAFSRADRLARIVEIMTTRLSVPEAWRFVTAARLSQLGCIGLPADLLAKLHIGQALDPSEQAAYQDHPIIGRSLLLKIPRLEEVAAIVGAQLDPPEASIDEDPQPYVTLGANLLRAALQYEGGRLRGVGSKEILEDLRAQGYSSEILDALRGVSIVEDSGTTKVVNISDLNVYMQLDQDVRSTSGSMLAAKGQRVTSAMLARFLNFEKTKKLSGPLRVRTISDLDDEEQENQEKASETDASMSSGRMESQGRADGRA
ncbi:MAG: response regulator [Nannocystaceae bacterium]